MTDLETNAAEKLSTRVAKSRAAMRAAITRADEARSDAAHQAATQTSDCRRGASARWCCVCCAERISSPCRGS